MDELCDRIFEATTDGAAPLALLDRDGRITGATPAAERLLEAIGVAAPVIGSRLPGELERLLGAGSPGEPVVIDPRLPADLAVAVTLHPLGDGRRLALLRPTAPRRVMLAQRLQANRQETIGAMAAELAHDLRNALSGVLYNVDALEADAESADPLTRHRLEAISTAGRRMAELVESLAAQARPPAERAVLVPLRPVLARVAALLRPAMRGGRHDLTIDVAPDVEAVFGNAVLVEHVVLTLFRAALALSPGPARVRAVCERAPYPGHVRLRVSVLGQPLPPALAARLFDPSFAVGEEPSGALALARDAARSQGGDASVSAGDDTTFTVELPADSANRP